MARRARIGLWTGAAVLLAAALAALVLAARAQDDASCRAFATPGTELWLVLGQSNAANHGEARTAAQAAVGAFDGRRCRPARDPLPGGTGGGGSLWPTLAGAWVSHGQAERVLLAMVAEESTSVADWRPGGRLHRRARARIEELNRRGLTVDRIFWIQGEADAILGTGERDYARGLAGALAPLHEASGAPVWIALASRCGDASSAAVRAAQRAAPARHDWARAGPDLDRIGPEARHERCHFTGAGQAHAVLLWLSALGGGNGELTTRR